MAGNLADGSEIRCYFVVNSGTLTPTEPQWVNFFQQARTKPLASAILAAAHSSQNFIAASKRSQGTGNVLKNTLCGFEIASENVAACIAVLNAQATIRGVSGTVSNKQGGLHGSSIANGGVGYACIAELRMYEAIETGAATTEFLRFGDRVRIDMVDLQGASIFGAIDQIVAPCEG